MDIGELGATPAVYTEQVDVWSTKWFMQNGATKAEATAMANQAMQAALQQFRETCEPGTIYSAILEDDVENSKLMHAGFFIQPTIREYCPKSFEQVEEPANGLTQDHYIHSSFERY